MKVLISVLLLASFSAHANLCDRYTSPDRASAIEALAAHLNKSVDEVCNSPRILDIELQPSQVTIDGVAVPQWAIFLHYNEDSCKYLFNRADLTLTSSKCFPTW